MHHCTYVRERAVALAFFVNGPVAASIVSDLHRLLLVDCPAHCERFCTLAGATPEFQILFADSHQDIINETVTIGILPMYIMTTHKSFVGFDGTSDLIQVEPVKEGRCNLVEIQDSSEDIIFESGPVSGFKMVYSQNGVSFVKDGNFLCAERGNKKLVTNRKTADTWETFFLGSEIPTDEITRFNKTITG